MDFSDNMTVLRRLLVFFSEGRNRPEHDLSRFSKGRFKLQGYYEYWRKRIRTASEQQIMLSNGWAFATLSGLATFESYIAAEPSMHSLYKNRVGEIDEFVEAIVDYIAGRKNRRPYGAIVYGYGNLVREAQWLQGFAAKGVVKAHDRVCLLDCSLFYHLFAKSEFNPLADIFGPNRLRPELVDCFDIGPASNFLREVRENLHAMEPAIHIFLGNTFGNVTTQNIRGVLEKTVGPGDFVVTEYARYSAEFLSQTEPDYTSVMARRAAAELFAIPEDQVTVVDSSLSNQRYAVVTVPDSQGRTLTFKSMLRRSFNRSELTVDDYRLVMEKAIADNKVQIDVLCRTTD